MADPYRVVLGARAAKDIRRLTKQSQRAALAALEALASEPRAGKPLVAELVGLWSLRRGDYRIVYQIDDRSRRVEVVRVAHRREVYRRR